MPLPECMAGRVQGQFEGDVHNLWSLCAIRLPRVWRVRYGHKGAILNGISG
jgi:hypothetical protein